jgi:diguanylate cyclase
LTVAVNVSARQIHSELFATTLHNILFETKLPPQNLELEITESTLIRDLARALSTLRLVKALGVRIAMDDFGTGYSSLSNLMSFPFDKIKIDASFIRSVNANDQAATIVRAVLGWAADYASRCWPKVLKPMRSFSSCNGSCAMRHRAISSAGPWRSRASGI